VKGDCHASCCLRFRFLVVALPGLALHTCQSQLCLLATPACRGVWQPRLFGPAGVLP
jgi:hypothetical protein